MTSTTITFDELYAFLKANYRPGCFERNDTEWGPLYSRHVTESTMATLRNVGWGVISHHDSKTGEDVYFLPDLSIVSEEDIAARFWFPNRVR